MQRSIEATLFAVGLSFMAIHCGGADSGSGTATNVDDKTPASGAESTQAAPETAGRVLATVAGENDHTFYFGQGNSGDLVVSENAPVGSDPVLMSMDHSGTILDLYARLSNNAVVPAALQEAADAVATHPTVANVEKAPTAAPAGAAPPKFYYSPTSFQTWFSNNFCNQQYTIDCDIQNGDPNASLGQWGFGNNFYAYGMSDNSNSGAGVLREWLWTNGAWVLDWTSGPVDPGYYWAEYWAYTYQSYRSADIQNVPGPSGLALWNSIPAATAAYTSFGQFAYRPSGWMFDTTLTWTIDGYIFSPTNGGISASNNENVGLSGVCTPGANDPNPRTFVFKGNQTGETVTFTENTGTFDPSKCTGIKHQ
jgi:hypothetical protein